MKEQGLISRKYDALGAMLLDYVAGKQDASVDVFSEQVEMWQMTGEMLCRSYADMDEVERRALQMCKGCILDLGAGSGCHTLHLQHEGSQVWALEYSPGCIEVMQRRGVQNIIPENFLGYDAAYFDTILIMMNGLGVGGTIAGLKALLRRCFQRLLPGGQILADSTDISSLFVEEEFDYSLESYSGEVEFVMRYGEIESELFPWIYIDFDTLSQIATDIGVQCVRVMEMDDKRFLARLFR